MNSDKIVSVRVYVLVFTALIALTVTTTAVAFVDLGATWNSSVALAIAIVKALLVVLFFMHVLYSRPLTWVFVGIGFFWLAILFALTLADYVTRDNSGAGPLASVPASSQAEQQRPIEIVPRVAR